VEGVTGWTHFRVKSGAHLEEGVSE
jgi:hypothetical protein